MCRRGLVLERHVDGVALGQELVQPEREQRPAGLPGAVAREPACSVRWSAFSHWSGVRAGLRRRARAAARWTVVGARRASRPSSSRSSPNAGLDPGGERVADQVRVVGRARPARRSAASVTGPASSAVARTRVSPITFSGERRSSPKSCEATSATTSAPLLGAAALGGHGGRGADALHVRRGAGVLDPADQQRHVRALPAPVGVQLVEDEELQALGHPDQRPPVVGPGQHQLQHHVVGEQDVRRVRADPVPVLLVLLAGVAGEGDRLLRPRG